ncbi:hypothetical protein [Pseudothauera rhizosphaerae]|uniref:Uncharacterized protein n=1 Tax=Pseudothauera rhizosphaerae TaxID=2565932 RepID=A0A4S4B013_9RHOO|nr:hypothetical protein [Pseudothauera rhizosphaerae]THF65339.1 hypothetical protein E6O51_01690 [Pseudothauera rhizosphaerae]
MLQGALLGLIDEACAEIVTLTEEVSEAEFFRSRLTHGETVKRLKAIAQAAEQLPEPARAAIAEIDWARWQELGRELAAGSAGPLAVWVAVRELAPLTLNWLRVYQQSRPDLFQLKP